MSETPNTVTAPPAAAAAPPKTFMQKALRWFMIVCGVIIGIGGLLKTYKAFSPDLPGCSADATTAAVRNIFKEKNVELSSLTDMKTVTDTSSEKTCQARIETPTERATISYRVSWQGREAQILITKVDAVPR